MSNSNIDNSETKEVDIQANKKSVVAGEEVKLQDEKSEEKTKKLLNKKIIIGIICILAIISCVVVYTLFISDSKAEETSQLEEENALLITDNETYEGLNYSMTVEIIEQLGFFYDYSQELEGNKIDVSYIKIDGLKDVELENKINEKLKSEAESMYVSDNIQDSSILYDHIYNYTDVYIFNNVLSTLYCEEKCDVEGNVTYTYKSVNINLRDFTDFSLKDVFTNTTNVEEIINSQTDVTYTESIVFSVSPKFVYVVGDNGKVDTLSLYENKDKVAIYKRFFDDKKLFDKTYNATPYAFTTKKFIESDVYGLEEDNLFIDTCNLTVNYDCSDEVKEASKTLYMEAVNKARNLAYGNPSKRFLVQIVSDIEKVSDNEYNLVVKYNEYEISKKFFDDNLIEFVVASENKYDEEISVVNYFDNTALNAAEYLNGMSSETMTKTVDADGVELKENINTNNSQNQNMGIS